MAKINIDTVYSDLDMSRFLAVTDRYLMASARLKQHFEEGLHVWNESESELGVLAYNAEQVSQIRYIILSFLVGLCARMPDQLAEKLGQIEVTAAESAYPEELVQLITDIARLLLKESAHEIKTRMYNGSENPIIRVVAALAVSVATWAGPDDLIYAHALLFGGWGTGMYLADVHEDAAAIVSQGWTAMARRTFLLKTPSLTVPRLLAACNSSSKGWAKVADVILAARSAANVRFPEEMIQQLRAAAADKTGEGVP